jgi:hypothetical protein
MATRTGKSLTAGRHACGDNRIGASGPGMTSAAGRWQTGARPGPGILGQTQLAESGRRDHVAAARPDHAVSADITGTGGVLCAGAGIRREPADAIGRYAEGSPVPGFALTLFSRPGPGDCGHLAVRLPRFARWGFCAHAQKRAG